MAYQHTALQLDLAQAAQHLVARISDGLAAFGHVLMTSSAGHARLERVEALRAKTDEELAAMNLRREDIVQYVFRDLYFI